MKTLPVDLPMAELESLCRRHLRNRLIRGYDAVDFDILHANLPSDLPIVVAPLERIVADASA